jgi:hypothetical protein
MEKHMKIFAWLRRVILNTRNPAYILPAVSRVLIVIFVFTNILYAHKPEETIWQERENAQHVQLAALPALLPPHFPGSRPCQGVKSPVLLVPLLVPVLNVQNRYQERYQDDPFLGKPPEGIFNHVNIRSAYKGADPRTVLILEDVHQNQEAQGHLSAAIKAFGEAPGETPVLVGLEGAEGPFLYDDYKSLSNRYDARRVADAFFQMGDISGPAHAGLYQL